VNVAVSLKELAKIAGVSVSTVTRALQNKPDVSSRTRRRILDLASEHNYRPNILARSLVTSRTYTIGVIVPDLTNPFFPALIKGVESTLWDSGYSVILADTGFDLAKERQTIEEFMARRVDALIICSVDPEDSLEWVESLQTAGIPFVSLTHLPHRDADVVVAADRAGARKAADHLLSINRRKIVYLGNPASAWANGERIEGVRAALAAAGIQPDDETFHSAASGAMHAARQATEALISRGHPMDAIIAFDDYMAIGVRAALVDADLRVPEDVALVGFDNIELAGLPDISLTTIDIPKLDLGRASASLAMERIDEAADRAATDGDERGRLSRSDPPAPSKEIVLNTKLIVRKSTAG
jgi:LacI family transcriptional regulator